MVLSHKTDSNRHPYWYARVLMIFHVNICYYGNCSPSDEPQYKDVLFVRWFSHDPTYSSIFQSRRLPSIGFLPEDDLDAFGFLDPDLVIQGVHLIPSFLEGWTSNLLVGHSIAQ